MTNLTVAFRNFANAPKSGRVSLISKQIFLGLCRLKRPPARLFVDCRLRKAKIGYLMLSLVHAYPGRQVNGEIKLYNGAPTICGSTARHLHHVTIFAPILLRWLLDFRKMYPPQCYKGRSGVFQHCCREGWLYSYPKWVPSFFSRCAAHQAAWETSASEGRNYTKEFS